MEIEERNIIQETDYRSLALTEAGKLNNSTPQELLSNADKIYQWLVQDDKKKIFVKNQQAIAKELADDAIEKIVWDGGEHFNK